MELKNIEPEKKQLSWSDKDPQFHEYENDSIVSESKLDETQNSSNSILKIPENSGPFVLDQKTINENILNYFDINNENPFESIEILQNKLPDEYKMYIRTNHGDLLTLIRKFPKPFKSIEIEVDKLIQKKYFESDDEENPQDEQSDNDYKDPDDEDSYVQVAVRRSKRKRNPNTNSSKKKKL
jgi:hypothetical protein